MLSEGLENIPCFIILPDVPKQFEGYASHEARCRMAACTRQPTGNRTRPASRGTCRATAVTRSQPAFPQAALRASGAQSGVQGFSPALGEDAAEVFAGLLGGIDEEVAHVQLDGLARFHAHALVGVGDDAQLLAAAQINAAVVHIA